jgi:hypothetical protein
MRLLWILPVWFHVLLYELTGKAIVRHEDDRTGEITYTWEKR